MYCRGRRLTTHQPLSSMGFSPFGGRCAVKLDIVNAIVRKTEHYPHTKAEQAVGKPYSRL